MKHPRPHRARRYRPRRSGACGYSKDSSRLETKGKLAYSGIRAFFEPRGAFPGKMAPETGRNLRTRPISTKLAANRRPKSAIATGTFFRRFATRRLGHSRVFRENSDAPPERTRPYRTRRSGAQRYSKDSRRLETEEKQVCSWIRTFRRPRRSFPRTTAPPADRNRRRGGFQQKSVRIVGVRERRKRTQFFVRFA